MDFISRMRIAFIRTVRPGVQLAAHLIVATMLLLQAILFSAGALQLEKVISNSWRGAYDILVLPATAQLPNLKDQQGRQLIDPNFANVDLGAHIPLDTLDQIKHRTDLDVIAPIGFLARLGNTMEWPTISLPLESFTDTPIQAFRIDSKITTDSGFGEHISQAYSNWIIVDTRSWDGKEPFPDQLGSIKMSAAYATQFVAENGLLKFSMWPLPVVSSTVFAVDPVQEAKLLGSAGQFLTSLAEFDSVTAANPEVTWSTVGSLNTDEQAIINRSMDQPSNELVKFNAYGVNSPLAPFVRNTDAYPPMDLTVTVSSVNETPHAATFAEISRLYTLPATLIGDSDLNLGELERPFSQSSIDLAWPGQDQTLPNVLVHPDTAMTLSALTLTPITSDSPLVAVRAEPQGFIRPIPNDQVTLGQLEADGHGLGQSQTYRSSQPANNGFSVGSKNTAGAALVEVATFSPVAINAEMTDHDYAPLGAYDPAPVEFDGQKMTPTLHGLGIAAQSSTAITSLAGAQTLGVTQPVGAIRIRVAGIEHYSERSVRKVQQIAGEISELGVNAFVVAGSSQQQVEVFVPDYAFGQADPDSLQEVADLGWVTTAFTTVGAAVTSESALLSLNSTLGDMGIGIALLALVVATMMGIPAQRQETLALKTSGFTTTRTRLWWAQEQMIPVGIVIAAAIIAPAVSDPSQHAMVRSALVVATVVVLAVITNFWATRTVKPVAIPRTPDKFTLLLESQTPALGRKLIAWHSPWLVLRVASLTFGAVALGLGVGASAWTQRTVSTTTLGAQLVDYSGWLRISLIFLAALVALAIFALAARAESKVREETISLLRRSLSWSTRQRLFIPRLETTVVMGMTLILAVTLSIIGGQILGFSSVLCAGVAAAVAITISSITHVRAARRWGRN